MKPKMLAWLAGRAANCERIVEVGCYHGKTTRVLLDASEAHVWCVDSWAVEGVSDADFVAFEETVRDSPDRVTILRMDSVEAGKRLLEEHGSKFFDLVFIDASHDFESVYADILAYRPLVKKGGILAGHDFANSWPGVQRAVRELVPGFERVSGGTIWWKRVK